MSHGLPSSAERDTVYVDVLLEGYAFRRHELPNESDQTEHYILEKLSRRLKYLPEDGRVYQVNDRQYLRYAICYPQAGEASLLRQKQTARIASHNRQFLSKPNIRYSLAEYLFFKSTYFLGEIPSVRHLIILTLVYLL